MIVTIDGPSGSGKTTTARLLAERLGFQHLDTGAMFRAVALHLLRHSIDAADEAAVRRVLPDVYLELIPGRIWLCGEDVTGLIRTSEVTSEASRIAVFPAVREFLAKLQRAVARGKNIVTEGRDQGTAVFPDAECKFFLDAELPVRAERRHRELVERGETITVQEVLQAMQQRDERDSQRTVAPLMAAEDAIVIDTSRLSIEEVLERMEREVRPCQAG